MLVYSIILQNLFTTNIFRDIVNYISISFYNHIIVEITFIKGEKENKMIRQISILLILLALVFGLQASAETVYQQVATANQLVINGSTTSGTLSTYNWDNWTNA